MTVPEGQHPLNSSQNPSDAPPLFHDVRFCIVKSKALDEDEAKRLITLLVSHRAQHFPVSSTTSTLPLEDVTHIISSTTDFPAYAEATDAYIPVVKPEWVDVSVSRNRTAQVRAYNPDPRLFFSGVVITCADIPAGDKDAIIGGVVAMGGQYMTGLGKMVTHIVALTEENEKCRIAAARKMKTIVVLPHWFDDCLKLGKRINEKPYTLPGAEIGRLTLADEVYVPLNPDLKGATSALSPEAPPVTVDTTSLLRRGFNVFNAKKIMLSDDLGLGSRLRGTIEDLIAAGGGSMTGSVHKADIFICQYREGNDYITAARAGKNVGNLPWLYYLITHNAWTSPMRRLLHYPIARGGLPGFENFKITLSNYGGDARLYLENLVTASGAEYTKTMRQDNTHLITARAVSDKCAAAQDWNVNMVNHLWLEESYAKWQVQSLSNPRYTHFPQRTNLGEVVGQTQIDRQALEKFFYAADMDMTSEDDDDDESTSNDKRTEENVMMTSSGTFPSADKGQTKKQSATASGASLDTPTPKAHRAVTAPNGFALKTPSTRRVSENEPPSSTSSRGAKDRAVAKLLELAPDIALFEKEKRRVGGVIHCGRRRSNSETDKTKKRSFSAHSGDDQSGIDGDDNPRDLKRAKNSKPPVMIKLLLTGYQRWVNAPKIEDEERRRLRSLGISCVKNPAICTHLAAPGVVRTHKFVSAMASAPVVVSTHWVDACLDKGRVLPPGDFLLKDLEGESRLGFVLEDALRKAKRNNRRLLAEQTIYCTPNTYETYKPIVEANGGHCQQFRGSANRHGQEPSTAKPGASVASGDESGSEEMDDMYLVSAETGPDTKLWEPFRKIAAGRGRGARIVKTEWILDIVMKQELNEDIPENFCLN